MTPFLKSAYEWSKTMALIAEPSITYKASQRLFYKNADCWIYDKSKYEGLNEALAASDSLVAKIEKTRFFL